MFEKSKLRNTLNKYGRKFGGCYVDVVWHYQKSMKLEVIDLWS